MWSRFEVIPAIDLLDGAIVRLRQGEFDATTRYVGDPAEVAAAFAVAGADRIHLVDLDGARAGSSRNLATLHSVVVAVGGRCAVEAAGGLRSAAAVKACFEAGADRVVLGTAAITDPSFAAAMVAEHGAERVAVAIDVRDGVAIGDGWRSGSRGRPVGDLLDALDAAGIVVYEVTAIERDGTRTGPDLGLLARVVAGGRSIVASGGVSSIGDVVAVRELGCSGVIIGRALYEGDLGLAEVVAALGD